MKTALSLAISIAISGTALASETRKTEETIVTATRTEQTYAETLASVTVFTRHDIEKFQVRSLSELLSKSVGMTITSTGGRGATTGISLRGNQTDHTLFLIDGIRVGSSTLGSTGIELIDPELIERVEIVRGPKSSLYGSDALGGVINIITRRANNNQPLTLKASLGNNNTRDASMSIGRHGDNYQANLTASYIYTDGFDNTESTTAPSGDDDAFRQNSLGFNGAYNVTEALKMGLSYQLNQAESEYDNSCSRVITYASVPCTPYNDSKTEAFNLSADWEILNNWTSIISVGRSKDESDTLADDINMLETTSGGEFNTKKTNISWINNVQINKELLLTLGYDFLNEEVSGTTDYDEDERDNDGYYTQLQWTSGAISANLGARQDDNEQFGKHDTYNISVGYAINQDLKIIGSYGQAFKAPTFNDLYFPNFGNPTMVPEETDTYELALKGSAAELFWTLSVFQNDVENLIQYNSLIFANDQIASATIEGAELSLQGEFAGWQVSTAFTFVDTEDDATGNELARRPNKSVNIDIDRSFGDWSIGTTLYAVGSRFNDAANQSELSGYGTIAIRGAYTVNNEWKIQLKADNLLEKDYVLSLASSFTGLGDYQQPGLEVLFSVVYTPAIW